MFLKQQELMRPLATLIVLGEIFFNPAKIKLASKLRSGSSYAPQVTCLLVTKCCPTTEKDVTVQKTRDAFLLTD